MYKYRGKVIKRKEKNLTDRIKKKMEGNLNITSKRLTIPPGFLSQGIISDTVKKDTSNNSNKGKLNIYEFFSKSQVSNSQQLRRSARISKKNIITFNVPDSTSSSSQCESEPRLRKSQYLRTPSKKTTEVSKNKSKSLFRQINERYAEIENHSNCNTSSSLEINSFSDNRRYVSKVPINSDFCDRLSQQISVIIGNKALDNCKSRLKAKIKNIDDIISGKLVSMSHYNKENILPKMSSEESQGSDFNFVPPEEWVYETPPRQKPRVPKVNECNIQPAVLYTNNNRRSLYEMNPNISIDLTRYSNKQNVPYDKRFMQHIATVDHSGKDVDDGIRFLEPKEQNCFNFLKNFQLSQFEETHSAKNLFNFGNYYSKTSK